MEFGNSMLFKFIINHKVEQVKRYLDTNINLNAKDRKGKTALYVACDHGDLEIVKLLLANDVDVDSENTIGWTALDIAAFRGRKEIVSVLKHHKMQKELAKLEQFDLAM